MAPLCVYGLGDPVLDVISRVEDSLLQQLRVEPGGCVAVGADDMERLLALPEVQASVTRVPGGSAANVMRGLAGLAPSGSADPAAAAGAAALRVSFVGMVGRDAAGAEYRSRIAAQGVVPLLSESGSGAPTGTCLCLVTPDGQRTMRTSLGAALELASPQQLPPELGGDDTSSSSSSSSRDAAADGGAAASAASRGVALLHCEGYCLYRLPVAAAAMRAARAAGARVSLDLASFEVVLGCWQKLESLLQERLVDIVFCNEQEAQALCQAAGLLLPEAGSNCSSVAQAVAAAQDFLLGERGVGTVVVSRGSNGCAAKSADGTAAQAPAPAVPVVDTIGAGDYFTSGVLLGLISGASLQASAECGCAAGAAAVTTAGAELPPEALQRLRGTIAGILAADRAQQAGRGAAVAAAALA